LKTHVFKTFIFYNHSTKFGINEGIPNKKTTFEVRVLMTWVSFFRKKTSQKYDKILFFDRKDSH